jgi:hypothetical protein
VVTTSFPEREFDQRNYDDLSVTLGEKCPSCSTVKNWAAPFRTGNLSTEDEEVSGRPTQVEIEENVDAIHSMILGDRRMSAKKKAETLVISRARAGCIIHKISDMRKLSAKLVPKYLNAGQKHDRVLLHNPFWSDFGGMLGILNRLIIMDTIWIYIHD